MNQEETPSSVTPMLLSFLAGAAIGAVLTALLTPRTGPEMRGEIKGAAARAKLKAEALAQEAAETLADLKERSRLAAADLKRGLTDSVAHLKQPAPGRAAAESGPEEAMSNNKDWGSAERG